MAFVAFVLERSPEGWMEFCWATAKRPQLPRDSADPDGQARALVAGGLPPILAPSVLALVEVQAVELFPNRLHCLPDVTKCCSCP